MAEPRVPRQQRAADRRAAIVSGAVSVLMQSGPGAFSARTVAHESQVPLAAISYYFPTIEALLAEAAGVVVERWLAHARHTAAARTGSGVHIAAATLALALLPPGGRAGIAPRYELLVSAARVRGVAEATAGLGPALEQVATDVLRGCSVTTSLPPRALVAVVDGTAMRAIGRATDPAAVVTSALVGVLRAG